MALIVFFFKNIGDVDGVVIMGAGVTVGFFCCVKGV